MCVFENDRKCFLNPPTHVKPTYAFSPHFNNRNKIFISVIYLNYVFVITSSSVNYVDYENLSGHWLDP